MFASRLRSSGRHVLNSSSFVVALTVSSLLAFCAFVAPERKCTPWSIRSLFFECLFGMDGTTRCHHFLHCFNLMTKSVPEFANVKRQLEGLEDRLEGMVQPRLADALTQRKVGL
jgi:hypothetical protein